MGLVSSVEAKTKEVLAMQRVMDLKQKKRERDMEQSMKLAATRDRILWVAGYYAVLGLLAGTRHLTLPVSYTHLRAHETPEHLVCRLLLEKKKKNKLKYDIRNKI
eukprot:TRINITY_DN9111_c0_g1_i4.p1 TRINITY_DN9111_c0_g1~~TRINITY_DN9111_c0_g1_i4.p1  ORF type:complete len:105 (-),score=38.47 TRINITY_DN9111_c0_g1_i4:32-346(-)